MLRRRLLVPTLSLLLGAALPARGASPTPEQALQLTPVQNGVEYETPTGAEVAACTIKAEQQGKFSGWVVRDAAGQMLRRFADTNGDNVVDMWCYYRQGIEVYRDVDSDYDGKADQYRWLNTAGSRWGIDKNEDGKIDHWRTISAEEVTAEAVRALGERDADRFALLLLTSEELKDLGLGKERADEVKKKVAAAKGEFATAAGRQHTVQPKTTWLHFGATQPGLVPAGTDGSTKDLMVYENAVALVETAGQPGQVLLGTLVRVGSTWRLIDAPQVLATDAADQLVDQGYFFRSPAANPPATPTTTVAGGDDEIQKLLAELEKLDGRAAAAVPAEEAGINARRADLLEQLAEAAEEPADRAQWTQQLADTISAAVQSGGYPDGVERLHKLYEKLAKQTGNDRLAGYVKFRYLTAEYGLSLQDPKADFAKIQTGWLKSLEEYVDDYPDSPDTAEALLQLAIAEEFAGQEESAKKWYGRIVKEFPNSAAATKSAGAITRLDSVGKTIRLVGNSTTGAKVDLARYRGKVVLLHYWATWCQPCIADLSTIKQLYAKYGKAGFVPIGVNLDTDKNDLNDFLRRNRLPWPQLYEPGSLDGRLANELGVLTLPTMLLIDSRGRVVNRAIHISELETELKKYLK